MIYRVAIYSLAILWLGNACSKFQALDAPTTADRNRMLTEVPVLSPLPGRTPDNGDVAFTTSPTPTPTPTPTPNPTPTPTPTSTPTPTPTPTPSPSPSTACTTTTPGLNALEAAIQAAPGAAQATTLYWVHGCTAGLDKFAANAVDQSGNSVKSGQFSGSGQSSTHPHVGVYCYFSYGSNQAIDLLVEFFYENGIRGPGIAATYLCAYGSSPANCTPSSSDFIAGFEYAPKGQNYRTSNIQGVADAQVSLASDLIVSAILTPGGSSYSDLSCQPVALWSPLVIERNSGQGVVTLNPHDTETYFDMDGAGYKQRISCVRDGAFLVLPNENGQVLNIDQLFGNNTVGPDGYQAANGFLALGKYDHKPIGDGFGYITPADPIYDSLMLWQDANCDGIAQPSELTSIADWGIESIQWIEAIPMIQVDPFGNHTEERNLATVIDGPPLRVFDIWFKAN